MRTRTRIAAALTGALAVTATAAAAAGLTVVVANAISGQAQMTACDSNVNLALAGKAWSAGQFTASGVRVSQLDDAACAGWTVDVVAYDSTGAALGEGTAVVGSNPQTVTLTSPVVIDDVDGLAVLISQ